MRMEFEDDDLRRVAYEPDFCPKGWSKDLVKAYRRVINLIGNAVDDRDLRNLKGLRLEQLKGNRAGTSSVRINSQYRLILKFETADDGRLAIVVEAVDYH